MRASIRVPAALAGAALTLGGLAVAVAPSAAACGGYGEPACQTFVLSFSANGGVCSPTSVSATENTWATLLSFSQCTRSGFTLASWAGGGSLFEPGAEVFVTGNNGFTAVWTATTPTSSPTPTGGTTAPPPTGPTASPTATPTPTVSIPAGQTNPNTPQRPAPGVVVVTQALANRTEVTPEISQNTRRVAQVNAAEIARGSVFQAGVRLSSFGEFYKVRLQTPEGEFVDFGSIRANNADNPTRPGFIVTIPAVRYTAEGTYFWSFSRGSVVRYIAIAVS